MQSKRAAAALFVLLIASAVHADTIAPPGMGTAGWWVHPCELFDRQVTTQKLLPDGELAQATLCQGLFTGIMSVNYIDPPYLPFCEGDNDAPIEYARTFLAFMRANPTYADKKLGLVLLVALSKAHPKEQCAHGSQIANATLATLICTAKRATIFEGSSQPDDESFQVAFDSEALTVGFDGDDVAKALITPTLIDWHFPHDYNATGHIDRLSGRFTIFRRSAHQNAVGGFPYETVVGTCEPAPQRKF